MFHLNKSNEQMAFHVSSSISHQQNKIPQDLINNNNNILTRASNNNSLDSTILSMATNNMGKGRPRRQLLATNLDHQDDTNNKKLIHREIEKQRRKEMATLHARLRSLIPLEYIKGKRSMSDQMNSAVNYIESLQMRIAELGARRDALWQSNFRATDSASGSSNIASPCVAVHPCSAGVEVIFMSSFSSISAGHEGLALSRVLQLLLGQGLTMVSCVTTKVSDQRSLHNIQAEVKDATCVNLAQLQQTLNETILSWNNSPS